MQKVHAFRKRHMTQKEYRYFKCPKCQQSLRAPKGRGTIKVTCSNCQNQFIKKSDLLCFGQATFGLVVYLRKETIGYSKRGISC